MAHKTLVNGTAYEISGGKTLVNGTGYKIKSGKTMVGGTVYEVGFAPATAILTITASNSARDYLAVYGTYTTLHIRYTTPDGISGTLEINDNGTYKILKGSYEFPVGTTIRIESEARNSKIYQYLYLNGTLVNESDIGWDYIQTLTTNTVISEIERSYMYTRIDITEE